TAMYRRTVLLGAAALAAASPARAAGKGTVRIAYVEWSDTVVATNILAKVLEGMGYQVTMTPVSAAAMWQAVASDDADCMVAAWLPGTHAAYYAKLKDQIDLVGPNLTGARLGWATPQYSPLNSIADLKTQGGLVDNKVIGIDPGAGLMRASEKTIKDYGLSNITLVEGSDATMVGALKDAITRKQPIVVTAWTPHWMFAAYKLKYLADPKGSLGGEETVNTVARKGLKSDMPDVYAVLSRFKLSLDDEQALMMQNQAAGTDPAKTASAWVQANPGVVKTWAG
ncbi:MAG TPA: glycine betaine ABC transporter substrate-binding protein, partial [Acetobacteraceae bacterium]